MSAEAGAEAPAVKKFPYHNGVEAGGLLLFKMAPEERDKVLEMLLRDRDERQRTAAESPAVPLSP
ncbi:hypothetical protein ACFW9I_34265 [[Kitasatospora] papulosa]|uniref:hypothetical protein n=1 Tax=[Kitasatospora] papulosa TaxID=1464011 RepID=UPI0036B4B55D